MKGSIATSLLIIGSLILGGCVAIQKYFTPQKETPKVIVGAVNYAPSGGGTYRTVSSISSTQTTITLSSFAEPVSGTKYTMAVLNSDIAYGTIAPQTNYTEFISFTGITQNANGTATLTGVVRGLGRSYPYAETSALKQPHSAQSIFILSNSPSLYSEYVTKRNDQTITGINTFTASPIVPTPTLATQAANKAYADSLTIAGTPVADTATGGRVQIATGLQMASSTPLGSATGNPYLALTTNNATSTYGNGSTSRLKAVITQNDGKIDSNFIRQGDNFAWTGNHTSSGTLLRTASTTLTATTTIAASSVTNNALVLNGANTAFPSSNKIGFLLNDGIGNYSLSTTTTKNATGLITTSGTGNYSATLTFNPININFSTVSTSGTYGFDVGSWSYPTSNAHTAHTFNANGGTHWIVADATYSIYSKDGTNPSESYATVTSASSTGFTIGFTKGTNDVYIRYNATGY